MLGSLALAASLEMQVVQNNSSQLSWLIGWGSTHHTPRKKA
jgi:hypothetical protein